MSYSTLTLQEKKKKKKTKRQYGLFPDSEITFHLGEYFPGLSQTSPSFHRRFTGLARRLLCWFFHEFSALILGEVKILLELPRKPSGLGRFGGHS